MHQTVIVHISFVCILMPQIFFKIANSIIFYLLLYRAIFWKIYFWTFANTPIWAVRKCFYWEKNTIFLIANTLFGILKIFERCSFSFILPWRDTDTYCLERREIKTIIDYFQSRCKDWIHEVLMYYKYISPAMLYYDHN